MADKKRKQFAVLGLGLFGISVAKTICDNGYEVLGVDKRHEVVQEHAQFFTHSLVADVSDENALRAIGIENFDVVIIAMSENFEATILATMLAKELGAGFVLVKAKTPIEEKILQKVGADKTICPESEIGGRVALGLISKNIIDSFVLASDSKIIEITPLKTWINYSIKDTNIRSKYGLNIIAVHREGKVIAKIDPDLKILAGDTFVASGANEMIDKFIATNGD